MILWQFFSLSFLLLLIFMLVVMSSGMKFLMMINEYFILDNFGLCLSIIPLFSLLSLLLVMNTKLNSMKFLMMLFSCMFSTLCFCCSKLFLFYIFYELSIMLLLFSLFVGSPYSERCLAGWYFLGYLVFGGMPLLLLIMYFSINESKIICSGYNYLEYMLFFLFMTKMPLFPFHSWLPMVHAEAKSYVSIMLSGYMMKLGLLGVVRLFKYSGDMLKIYIMMFFLASCYFFFSCFCELDNKRWLAFLSLGHISMGMMGFFSMPMSEEFLLSTFSLGHALSVIFLFYFFSIWADMIGSRKWMVLINNNNNSITPLVLFGILSLLAFPCSILFFKEVFIFMSISKIYVFIMMFSFYILFSMLGPICMLSLLLSRLNNSSSLKVNKMSLMILLCKIYVFYFYFMIL